MSLFMRTQAQMGEGANYLENNAQGFLFANQQPHSSSQTPKGLFQDIMHLYVDSAQALGSQTFKNLLLTYKQECVIHLNAIISLGLNKTNIYITSAVTNLCIEVVL